MAHFRMTTKCIVFLIFIQIPLELNLHLMPFHSSSLDLSSHEVKPEIPHVSCNSVRPDPYSPCFPLNIFCQANNK